MYRSKYLKKIQSKQAVEFPYTEVSHTVKLPSNIKSAPLNFNDLYGIGSLGRPNRDALYDSRKQQQMASQQNCWGGLSNLTNAFRGLG